MRADHPAQRVERRAVAVHQDREVTGHGGLGRQHGGGRGDVPAEQVGPPEEEPVRLDGIDEARVVRVVR